jgi:hypothetical protein
MQMGKQSFLGLRANAPSHGVDQVQDDNLAIGKARPRVLVSRNGPRGSKQSFGRIRIRQF